jgi:APA family basic amino acid/polyamine antiporter
LFAFVIVAAGVIVLRVKDPHRPRAFRAPLFPFVPLAAIVCCGWLMTELPARTWWRFIAWLAVGLVFYFLYGFWKSRQRQNT